MFKLSLSSATNPLCVSCAPKHLVAILQTPKTSPPSSISDRDPADESPPYRPHLPPATPSAPIPTPPLSSPSSSPSPSPTDPPTILLPPSPPATQSKTKHHFIAPLREVAGVEGVIRVRVPFSLISHRLRKNWAFIPLTPLPTSRSFSTSPNPIT